MRKSLHIKAAKPAAQIALVQSVKDKVGKPIDYPPFIHQRRGGVHSYWHPFSVEVSPPAGLDEPLGERWTEVLQHKANRAIGVQHAGQFMQECRGPDYGWGVSLASVVESIIGGHLGPTERAFLDVIQELAMRGEQSLNLAEYIEQRRQQEIAGASDWLRRQQERQQAGGAA